MSLTGTFRGALVAATITASSLAGPALAQEATPSHLTAARDAIVAIGATAQFNELLLNAATQIEAELIANNPNLQSEISDMVDDEALELAPRFADLQNEVARVYARLFTEEELRLIADFYGSPAGAKLIEQGPVATREMVAAARIWATGVERDLRAAAQAGMRDLAPAGGAAAPQ